MRGPDWDSFLVRSRWAQTTVADGYVRSIYRHNDRSGTVDHSTVDDFLMLGPVPADWPGLVTGDFCKFGRFVV